MRPFPRFWRALEDTAGAAAWADWQYRLGEDIQTALPMLSSADRFVEWLPERDAPCRWYRVVEHGPGDFVGVPTEGGPPVPLRRQDVLVYRIDHRKLAQQVAEAFALEFRCAAEMHMAHGHGEGSRRHACRLQPTGSNGGRRRGAGRCVARGGALALRALAADAASRDARGRAAGSAVFGASCGADRGDPFGWGQAVDGSRRRAGGHPASSRDGGPVSGRAALGKGPARAGRHARTGCRGLGPATAGRRDRPAGSRAGGGRQCPEGGFGRTSGPRDDPVQDRPWRRILADGQGPQTRRAACRNSVTVSTLFAHRFPAGVGGYFAR